MIAEISAGLNSLKLAKDFVQALNGVQTAAAINDVKLTLQGHILDAQQALFTAQEAQSAAARRIAELEQHIVQLERWSAEKERYQLEDAGQGSVAYHLKPGMEPGEPDHWICPACYEKGQKSILKHETLPTGGAQTLVCHPCGFDIVTQGVRHRQPGGGSVPLTRA